MHLDEWHAELRSRPVPSTHSVQDQNDKIHPVIRATDPDAFLCQMVEAFNADGVFLHLRSAFEVKTPTMD